MAEDERVRFDYDFDKALAALVFLAGHPKVTNFDKKKAISLLFLADKAHLVRYGEPIFGEEYDALEYGSVPEKTLDILNAVSGEKVWVKVDKGQVARAAQALKVLRIAGHEHPVFKPQMPVEPYLMSLSELEFGILERVAQRYGNKTFKQLRDPIHPYAWEKAWQSKPAARQSAKMDYLDFFEGDEEADAAAREKMIEDFRFRRALSGS
jgi:uncharacterized phage-associated protein